MPDSAFHLSLGGRSYLIDLPQIATTTERTSLDTYRALPIVKQGATTNVDFEGWGLAQAGAVKLGEDPAAPGPMGMGDGRSQDARPADGAPRPGESYSDVILRLAKGSRRARRGKDRG